MSLPTLDRVLDLVLRVDAGLDIKFISEAGRRWLGGAASDEAPQTLGELVCASDLPKLRHLLGASAEGFQLDVRLIKGGAECWVHLRAYPLVGMRQHVLCGLDISPWKSDDSAYRFAAEHDDLTGLPNRSLLQQVLEGLVLDERPCFTVALMDLDGFKRVNDTYGHLIGDAVLVETAKRLSHCIGPDDMLARLGGDEFVIVFKDKDSASAKKALSGLLHAIARPFETAPHNTYLGISVGLAEFPAHGADYPTLLKHADMAMYQAKSGGKNRVSIYSPSRTKGDFSIRAALQTGIEEGEFYMEYQPQFDHQRRLVGAEALMRWISAEFGPVSPDKFIPVAEEAGLMPFLGRWALRYACLQLREFQQKAPGFVMSVNVSPIQFGQEHFDEVVLEALAEAEVAPSTLVLEITESTLMHSQERTERALAHLRDRGVRLSIDDFGTGFSSLAYLTRLPVSSIKIDKSFVLALEAEDSPTATNRKLVTAMIGLAHSIELKVVAEGVESESQFAMLNAAGCDLHQGYLLGRPMGAAALHALLQGQTGRAP